MACWWEFEVLYVVDLHIYWGIRGSAVECTAVMHIFVLQAYHCSVCDLASPLHNSTKIFFSSALFFVLFLSGTQADLWWPNTVVFNEWTVIPCNLPSKNIYVIFKCHACPGNQLVISRKPSSCKTWPWQCRILWVEVGKASRGSAHICPARCGHIGIASRVWINWEKQMHSIISKRPMQLAPALQHELSELQRQ